MRAYCWRVGDVLDIEPGTGCPECGARHVEYGDPGCGRYVDGHHCSLPQSHDGACAHASSVVEEVIES